MLRDDSYACFDYTSLEEGCIEVFDENVIKKRNGFFEFSSGLFDQLHIAILFQGFTILFLGRRVVEEIRVQVFP